MTKYLLILLIIAAIIIIGATWIMRKLKAFVRETFGAPETEKPEKTVVYQKGEVVVMKGEAGKNTKNRKEGSD